MNSLTLILEKYLKRTNSFIRFLLVGIMNTLTGLSIMLLLLNVIGLSYWLSTFIGNSAGAFVSYFLNRSFTFQSESKITKSLPRFIAVILVCYFISFTVSHTAAEIISDISFFGYIFLSKENLAVIIGTGFYTVMNYFGQKHLVFN
ncbi:GtrA family protein [Cytobacillus dafuensis]|uniref:GtrA family protein n=1 Tax=Cytobacillus dafuensis TaxID=1742359 RepID=A0A5B8Z543_CYTDA|nr:GtrA family protein [Cytobacillus dafuensis]QED48230.1 GtrA family protein [Cytobacillus dafuensis]